MKKLATILCAGALATGAFAQGTVTFLNGSYALVSTNATAIGGGSGPTATAAQGFYYALFTAASTVTSVSPSGAELYATNGGWTFTGLYATNIPAAGRLSGGSGVATITGWQPGATNSFCVAGWSSSLGHDWATVANEYNSAWAGVSGFFGVSAVAFGAAGGGASGNPAFPLWSLAANGQGTPLSTGLSMSPVTVPEPATLALAGLGTAALLIFRRRR